eukprot:4184047-Pyramimonas_sp.AAC.1
MADDDVDKQSSRGSSSGAGMVTIDGTTFMRVKTCPLSGVKNTDPNPVTEGPHGPEKNKFAIWDRGGPQKPSGNYERISMLTYHHGGFAHRSPDIIKFVEELEGDAGLKR